MSDRRGPSCWTRSAGRLLSFALVALFVLVSSVATAEDRIEFLANRLRNDKDFRVRANAALALGATDDDRAVAPLCDGLSDEHETVRKHSATAHERLKRAASLDCLKRRDAIEKESAVKLHIQRAI